MTDTQESTLKITISEEDINHFKRLDQLLSDKCEDLSRSMIKNLFNQKKISSSDCKLELKKMPPAGSVITIEMPEKSPEYPIAQDIKLEITYEDEDLLFINKPVGMVVHPAPGHMRDTLVNALLNYFPAIENVGDRQRPGIVHRLDKGTSGLMVVAKTNRAYEGLIKLFSTHDITREYQAIVMKTRLEGRGEIESPIARHPINRQKMAAEQEDGRYAKTYYNVLEFFNEASHLVCTLETGRTHQIRVHLSQVLKAPILMDPLYGTPKDHLKRIPKVISAYLGNYEHPLLHARKLGFIHPVSKKNIEFEVQPPVVFSHTLDLFRKDCQ